MRFPSLGTVSLFRCSLSLSRSLSLGRRRRLVSRTLCKGFSLSPFERETLCAPSPKAKIRGLSNVSNLRSLFELAKRSLGCALQLPAEGPRLTTGELILRFQGPARFGRSRVALPRSEQDLVKAGHRKHSRNEHSSRRHARLHPLYINQPPSFDLAKSKARHLPRRPSSCSRTPRSERSRSSRADGVSTSSN